MDTQTFEKFESIARAEGYDEVLVREWEPHVRTGEHTHPFDATLRVARGDLTLILGNAVRQLSVGDTCIVPRGAPHAEIYGSEGATIWVGRKN